MSESKYRKNWILRGDDASDSVNTYLKSEVGQQISEFLNRKTVKIDRDDFSYRLINHWEEHDLILDPRPDGKGWRRFNVVDVVWLHLIQKLRKFGLSIERITGVKNSFGDWQTEESDRWMKLEYYIALAFAMRLPVYLLVFEEEEALIATESDYAGALGLSTIGDHITIKLNPILQRLFPNKDLKPKSQHIFSLQSEEVPILEMLRLKDFESILIKRKSGKIVLFEGTEIVDNEKRIIEILKEADHQNIEIKQSDGKVRHIRRTVKRKP